MLNYFSGIILFPILESLSGRNIQSKLDDIIHFESKSNSEKKIIQKQLLKNFLEYAQSLNYYKEVFARSNFQPEMVLKDIKFIEKLPVLTKEIVKERLHDIRTPTSNHVRKTGGSTGQSAFFFYDDEGLDWTSAFNLYCYHLVGKKKWHYDCHIGADIDLNPPRKVDLIKHKIKLFSQNRTAGLLKSFSDDDLESLFQQIKKSKAYLVQCHPSTINALANYCVKKEKSFQKPLFNVFEPTGEMLFDKMVLNIETTLGAKVFNRYGNAEFGVLAHSQINESYNQLKVFERGFYVEDCSDSDLIVTNFTNTGMPLIRYNTGDVGSCENRESGRYIFDIKGRIHDTVKVDNVDYPTHYIMDFLDHKVGGIEQFQIIVHSTKKPVLHLVLQNKQKEAQIVQKIKIKFSDGFEIKCVEMKDMIQTGWRQKFRHIVDSENLNAKK